MGQQRFTDMEARVTVFLQDMDIPALLGQQGRYSRSGRPPSDDEDITIPSGVGGFKRKKGHELSTILKKHDMNLQSILGTKNDG